MGGEVIAALYVLAVSMLSLALGVLAALATRPVPEALPAQGKEER